MEKKQNVPALRFQGFSGEWEKYNLSMLSGVITKGTTPLDKSGKGDVNFIKIENIDANTGAIHVTQKISQEEHNGYLKRSQLKENDILFSIAGTLGRVAVVKANLLPANTNQALAIIRLKKGNFQYVKTYLQGKAVENFLKANPTVGAQPNLSLAQVGDLEVVMPEESKEQENISDFFQYWDELIFHTMAKIKRLRQFRQAMLTKLFPREGAAEPELRFRGFSGKWKSCCLTDIATINPPGELPETFNYVDLESVIGTEIVKYRRETKFSAPSRAQRVAEDNDVFYQMVRPYQKNNCIFRGNDKTFVFSTGYAQLRPNCNSYFLLSLLQTEYFVGKVMELCTGTSFPAISASDLSRIPIYVPVMSEENGAIGEYFQNLDSYISLQQKKLERMQRLKAALLEKLFV